MTSPDQLEQAAQARAWTRALAAHWLAERGKERQTIEDMLVAEAIKADPLRDLSNPELGDLWFRLHGLSLMGALAPIENELIRRARLIAWGHKGGPGSGNFGHAGRPGKRGGSLPRDVAMSLRTGPTAQERQRAAREAGKKPKEPEKPPARAKSADEEQIGKELEDTTKYLKTLKPGEPAYVGVQGYAHELETMLDREQAANDALWRMTGKNPAEATEREWADVADRLHNEGYELYKQYDLEGISIQVDEMRNAQEDTVASLVGGQWVTCNRGKFSRREAARIKAQQWDQAKETLGEAMGQQLTQAGYRASEIAGTSFQQRQRLLRELGEGRIVTTRAGNVSRIGGVSATARERVLQRATLRVRADAARTALSPVDVPTIGAYRKMELADLIRMRYQPQGGPAPLGF